jgi:hypothetical protein
MAGRAMAQCLIQLAAETKAGPAALPGSQRSALLSKLAAQLPPQGCGHGRARLSLSRRF